MKGGKNSPFKGPLTVSDTSRAVIVSGDYVTPASYDGEADSVTLQPAADQASWKVAPGAASGKYAFTVTQSEEGEAGSGLYRVEIQGRELEPVPEQPTVPATGDPAAPALWLALCALCVAGLLAARKLGFAR